MNTPFKLERLRIVIERNGAGACVVEATAKILVNGQTEIAVAEGAGPISALSNALAIALRNFYPRLNAVEVADDFDGIGWGSAMPSRWLNLVKSYESQIIQEQAEA